MDPTQELAERIALLVDSFLRKHDPTSGDKRQIYDDLDGPLQTQRELIKQQRNERKQLVQEDVERLVKERERIDNEYEKHQAFIHLLECSIGKKPTGKKPKNVDSAHTDKDGGDGTNQAHISLKEGERYPTAPPSPQGDQFSQAREHLSSSKRRASSSGLQDHSRPGVKNARRRFHSPGREDKREVNYPDVRPSVALATDDKTYRSQPVTPAPKKNILVSEPIVTARIEVSSSEENSPSLVKNMVRPKKKSREPRGDSGGSPGSNVRRSTRTKEKVHYSK